MKTSNISQGRAHREAIIRGWVSPTRAGGTGVTVGDGTTDTTGITGITVNGGTVVDNGDGTVTITFTSGDVIGWFNVQDYGALGDGSTDDTVAIQATIDAATTAGGGVIYFPPGEYVIGGALQDTGAFNGQLLLPNVSTSNPQITLTFQGALRPPLHPIGTSPDETYGYSILRSTLTGASGTAAVISGGNGSFPTKNNVQCNVKDLICLSPDNPTMSWWNLSTTQGGEREGLLITVVPWSTASQPTHSNSYGIKLPQWGQSNTSIAVGDIMVGGHYTGILQGELSVGVYVAGLCVVAVELPFVEHPSTIISLQQTACTYGIKVTGAHKCDVHLYASEHYTSPAWADTVYDLDDGSNNLYGNIRWWGVAVGGADDHVFDVNGGSHVTYSELGSPFAGSSLTIKDEGGALATAATSIDFVGAGVVASGATAAKTVTIAGGATAADTGIWRPLLDAGTGAIIQDATTGEAIMSFGPA